MTTPTPTPAPFSPPDQAGWSAPGAPAAPHVAPALPQAAPTVPPGYASAPAPFPQATSSVGGPGRQTSMWLTLEGATGSQFAIYHLDKNRPDLYIDGIPAKRDINGYFKIPMANGKKEKLRVRASVPGYPTIKFRGKTLYKSPKPSPMLVLAYLVPALGSGLMVAGWVGGLLGGATALGVGYGAAAWLRKAETKTVPYVVLIAGGLFGAALGVVGILVQITLRN